MKTYGRILVLGLILTLTACVGQISPILKKESHPIEVGPKIPLKVALLVPDAARNLNIIYYPDCIDGITPAPYGVLFQETTREILGQIFSEVSLIRSLYEAEKGAYDTFMEATLSELHWELACALDNPNHRINAKGNLRVLDKGGRTVWKSQQGSQIVPTPHVSDIENLDEDVGMYISKTIGLLVAGWAKELINSPEFLHYAKTLKSAPAPAEVAKAPFPPAKNLPPLRPDTYAVIIGIDYKGRPDIPNLQFSSQDAQKVYEVLTDPRYGGVPRENALLLLNERATTNGIKAALRKIKNESGTIYIYFSGHGAPKIQGDKFVDAFLVPYDADISSLDGIDDTGIKLSYLQELMDASPARGIMAALDACFTGGGKSIIPKGGKPLVGVLASSAIIKPSGSGKVILTSSASNQTAWEDEKELKGGIFSFYLLDGLKGKAGRDVWVKMDDLAEYIKENVPKAARKFKGVEQVPQVSGKGDFAVARNWERAQVMDVDMARARLKAAFENGNITADQLNRALDELKAQNRSKTLQAFLEGKIEEGKFGDLY
jgi:hypothetical protein